MRVLTLTAALLTATLTYAQDNIVLRNGEEIPVKVLEVNRTDLKYRKSANPDGPVYTAPLRDGLLIKYANGTKDVPGQPVRPLPGVTGLSAPAINGQTPGLTQPRPGTDALRYHGGLFSRYFVDGNGQRLSGSETHPLLATNHGALMDYRSGQSLRRWTYVTAIPAVALIGVGIGFLASGNGEHDGMIDGRNTTDDMNDTNPAMNGDNKRDGHGDGATIGATLVGGGVLLGIASVWLDHRAAVKFRRAADQYNNRTATSLWLVPSSRGVGLSTVLTF